MKLAGDSIAVLGRHVGADANIAGRWKLVPPTGPPMGRGCLGLPLLLSCSPDSIPPEYNLIDHAIRWQAMTAFAQQQQIHHDMAARLSLLMAAEHALWQAAGQNGGPSGVIPYAYRHAALSWWWRPELHAPNLPMTMLCIRCGSLIEQRRKRQAPPRCHDCSKESPQTRRWPGHAVAPHDRGRWWLRCHRCQAAFTGRADALYCPLHRSARLTPTKR